MSYYAIHGVFGSVFALPEVNSFADFYSWFRLGDRKGRDLGGEGFGQFCSEDVGSLKQ